MRFMIAILILFMSTFSFASLKLSTQANLYDKGHNTRPQVGLSWYQPIMRDIALNTWAGYGNEPFEIKDDVNWFGAKAQLDFRWKRVVVSPGVIWKHLEPSNAERSYGFLRVDYVIFY